MNKTVITYLFIFFFSITSFSQESSFREKSSFALNFKLPKATNNKPFKSYLLGLANIDATFQYRIGEKFEIGLGYKYGYFDINSSAFQTKVDGQMENYNPFIKLGLLIDLTEKMFLRTAINSGYNFSVCKINTSPNNNYLQNSLRFEPEIGLYMFSTDHLAFGLVFSYNFWFEEFIPEDFNLQVSNSSNHEGIYQTFCVGFGFYSLIPPPKTN